MLKKIIVPLCFVLFLASACQRSEFVSKIKAKPLKVLSAAEKSKFSKDSRFDQYVIERIERLEADPSSEEAHTALLGFLLQTPHFDLARKVVSSLKALNPNSQRALVFEKHINEIEALNEKKVDKATRMRQSKEMQEAIEKDVLAYHDNTTKKLLAGVGKNSDTSDFLKLAEQRNKELTRQLLKRYPDLCKSKTNLSSAEAMQEFELQREIFKIQTTQGTDGLRASYPKLLEQNPRSNMVLESYLGFLLRQGEFEQAVSIFNANSGNVANTFKLKIFRDSIERIDKAASVEQKRAKVQGVLNDWMYLGVAQTDCLIAKNE
jgi:hypothetical protein